MQCKHVIIKKRSMSIWSYYCDKIRMKMWVINIC